MRTPHDTRTNNIHQPAATGPDELGFVREAHIGDHDVNLLAPNRRALDVRIDLNRHAPDPEVLADDVAHALRAEKLQERAHREAPLQHDLLAVVSLALAFRE